MVIAFRSQTVTDRIVRGYLEAHPTNPRPSVGDIARYAANHHNTALSANRIYRALTGQGVKQKRQPLAKLTLRRGGGRRKTKPARPTKPVKETPWEEYKARGEAALVEWLEGRYL